MNQIRLLEADIKEMIGISYRLGVLQVEYRNCAEIKRGKMPDEKRLKAMRDETKELQDRLLYLKTKWLGQY